jgi:hypothetical protein
MYSSQSWYRLRSMWLSFSLAVIAFLALGVYSATTSVLASPTRASSVPTVHANTLSKRLKWNYHYTIRRGDTLSTIAQNVTRTMHVAGAPSNILVTYWQIYTYNKAVIIRTAKAHGDPVPRGMANNIFPGEKCWLPTWS